MSSNRLIYDKCAYDTTIKESTSSLNYNLYKGKYEKAKPCAVGNYSNIIETPIRAEIENELYGLNRQGTLCPTLKYDPFKNYKSPNLSPNRMCENIYYITPNNLEKPKTNMLNERNLGL